MKFSVKISADNTDKVLEQLDRQLSAALEACGLQAERYAKMKCPVDTGLLRNSITHVVSGQKIQQTYHAAYGSNRDDKGKRLSASSKNAGSVGYGSYSGTVGNENEHKVIIGTNVNYAPYVELGHSLPSGGTVPPRPFLKPAVAQHGDKYKAIIRYYLKNGV